MIPAQVAADAARVDDMIRAMANGETPAASEVEDVSDEDTVTEIEAEDGAAEVIESSAEPEHQAPEPAPEPPVSKETEIVRVMREDLARAEQRYKSLQGMFNQQAEQLKHLTELLANMQAQPAAPAAPVEDDNDDAEAFGSDLVQAMQRQAETRMRPYIQQLEDRIGQLTAQLNGVAQSTQVSAWDSFVSKLTAAVDAETGGQFGTINSDQGFMAFVQEYAEPWDQARREMDVEKTLRFYRLYAKEHMLTGKPTRSEPVTPAGPDPRLLKQVSPGKSKATPTPAAQAPTGEKRQWTRTEIADFMNKKLRGQIPKQTADKLERDLFDAQREGRVDYSR